MKMVVKTRITDSVRGQSLADTVDYLKNKVIDHNHCSPPETVGLCDERNQLIFTKVFL